VGAKPPLSFGSGRRAKRIHGRKSGNLTPKEPTLPTGRPRAAISWSGRKDSGTALHRTHPQYNVACLITRFGDAAVGH
jgi:hypothetical protein